jgi:ribosomal protein S18 acetylase RimI-like enzyme
MRRFTAFLAESPDQPVCVFLCGGSGAGKTTLCNMLFDVSGSNPYAFHLSASDIPFEYLLRKSDIDPHSLADIERTDPERYYREIIGSLRSRAGMRTVQHRTSNIHHHLNIIIDGTGDDFDKVAGQKEMVTAAGYRTCMIFVDTSLATSLARNRQRERTVPDTVVVQTWTDAHANVPRFRQLFDTFWMIDNEPGAAGLTAAVAASIRHWLTGLNEEALLEWTNIKLKLPLPDGWRVGQETTGYYSGQTDFNIGVYDEHGKRVAYVDYTLAPEDYRLRKDGGMIPDRHGKEHTDQYDGRVSRYGYQRDEIFIKMIEVLPEYQRRGLGMALLRAVSDEHKLPINSGMRTDDGGQLWAKWVNRPERLPESVAAPAAIELVPSSVWEHFRSTDQPDEYFYHVTLEPFARSIVQQQAIRPNARGLMGKKGSAYEGNSSGRVFVTDKNGVFFWVEHAEMHAMDQYDDPPSVAVVRFRKSLVNDAQGDHVGSADAKAAAWYIPHAVEGRLHEAVLSEAANMFRQGFIAPDGKEIVMPGLDHTEVARKLLKSDAINSIRTLLEKGYIRFWRRSGEIALNFKAGKPQTARVLIDWLKDEWDGGFEGDSIYMDAEGAPADAPKFFKSLREANVAIRRVGGLHEAIMEAMSRTTLRDLKSLRAKLAAVAQDEYDKWDEDEDEYAGGGICHLIADRLADVLIANHFEVGIVSAQIGDQHVWCVAKTDDGVVSVDIPPGTYERGGGYTWTKLQGVRIEADDVVLDVIDHNPDNFEQYTEEG